MLPYDCFLGVIFSAVPLTLILMDTPAFYTECAPKACVGGFTNFPEAINSDHAEVRVEFSGIKFATLNLSNRHYHSYFNYGDWWFGGTHLWVPEGSASTNRWLLNKHLTQIDNIKTALIDGTVDVYCLQEANVEFIQTLNGLLDASTYRIYHAPDHITGIDDPKNYKRNVTIIVVAANRVPVIDSGFYRVDYTEENGDKPAKQCRLIMPWVRLGSTTNNMYCYSVHVAGNSAQFPAVGINRTLQTIIKHSDAVPAIAIGDYNTVTANIDSLIWNNGIQNINVYNGSYPTHLNTLNNVCCYDNVVIYYGDSDKGISEPSFTPSAELPPDSVALVGALLSLL